MSSIATLDTKLQRISDGRNAHAVANMRAILTGMKLNATELRAISVEFPKLSAAFGEFVKTFVWAAEDGVLTPDETAALSTCWKLVRRCGDTLMRTVREQSAGEHMVGL